MYKKMLIAGVAGLLTLPAVAVTAAPAQAAQKICFNKTTGETKVTGGSKSCAKKFGSDWKRASAESLGLVGPAGGHGASAPSLTASPSTDLPAAGYGPGSVDIHHAAALINNYDPNVTYYTAASSGKALQVIPWAGGPNNPTEVLQGYVMVSNLKKGEWTWLTVSAQHKNGAPSVTRILLQSYFGGTGT